MKKIVLFMLIFGLVIGVMGCMNGQKKGSPREKMLEYINEKYDDTFEYVRMDGGSADPTTKHIIVKSQKYPDIPVYVTLISKDGDEYFDNYLNVKFAEETKAYIQKVLAEKFGENICVKYNVSSLGSVENGSDSTTFDEYIASSETGVDFTAVIGNVSMERNIEEISEAVKEVFSKTAFDGTIFFTDDNIDYSDETGLGKMENCIQNESYNRCLVFVKDDVENFLYFRWE